MNGISTSIKSIYTEPASLFKEVNFPHLFNTNNKENELNKRINSTKDDKWKYMTNPHPNHPSSSSKKILNKSNSKQALK